MYSLKFATHVYTHKRNVKSLHAVEYYRPHFECCHWVIFQRRKCVCHKTSLWLRPAASYVSGAGLWGTHSSPSRSSTLRWFWGILSCKCMFQTCIQRSSPLFWCTAHYVCSCHRRFRHLENSNTDCLFDESTCGFKPGRDKGFFLVFKTLRPALGRTLSPIQCAGGFFPAGKASGAWN